MYKNLAVSIIHGMGKQKDDYAREFVRKLKSKFAEELVHLVVDPAAYLFIEPVYWASIFERKEDDLFEQLVKAKELNYQSLRKFIIQYVGDVIAYQRVETAKHNYDQIHMKIAKKLNILSKKAGKDAPLCVISHSLGSAIASNYFYDLQFKKGDIDFVIDESSPLENGHTLTLFYTMGTTLPLWSLRYNDFDRPINIPAKELHEFHHELKGEWINFYDKDDVLGYPLKPIDKNYGNAVKVDKQINIGGPVTSWNPLSHIGYFKDSDVINSIADGLVRTWKQLNHF